MISNEIKKDTASCAAGETTNIIIKGICDVLISIFIDESREISAKEQMAVVLCYWDCKCF